MKRLVWLLILVFSYFFPIHTFAQETNEIHGEWTNHLYEGHAVEQSKNMKIASLSDESLEELAKVFEEALLQRKTAFTIHYSGDTSNLEENMNQIIESTLLNNEYLSYDFRGLGYSGSGTSESITLSFTAEYYQTAEQVAYVDNRIKEILAEIIQADMNIHEKVKAVHDYIVLHIEYDTSDNQAINAPYFALTEERTMCNGYAMLMYSMLQELEIPVRLISGSAGGIGHAWNLVQLDGEWYHLDATWDDPVPDEEGRIVYNYYMMTDEMIDDDHFWQEGGLNGREQSYPTAEADYAEKLSTLGYDELAEDLDLHYLASEFTSNTDEEIVSLVTSYFNKMAEEFSIRFVTTDENIKVRLGELIKEAASQTGTKSWFYSWKEYPRTETKDFIVTISTIDYVTEVSGIEMQTLPERVLKSGEKIPLHVSAKLSNETSIEVAEQATFTVHDLNIVAIRNGYLIAKGAGSTTIDVSFHGKETSFDIKVEEESEELAYPIEGYKPFGEKVDVESDKIWTVKFNLDIDSNISNSNVYVLNKFGDKEINLIEIEDSKTLQVHPPTGGYTVGKTYYLVIENSLRSAKGSNLREAVTYKFTISE